METKKTGHNGAEYIENKKVESPEPKEEENTQDVLLPTQSSGKVVLTDGKVWGMSATGLHCIPILRHTSYPSFPTTRISHEMG